jgi:hypothetical protein
MVSESRPISTEFFCRLGYYAAWGGLKPTFRYYLSVHLQGEAVQEEGRGSKARYFIRIGVAEFNRGGS